MTFGAKINQAQTLCQMIGIEEVVGEGAGVVLLIDSNMEHPLLT